MLSEQEVLAQDANIRKATMRLGKCTGLGRDKDGNPNCVCEDFLLNMGAAHDSIASSQ
jgi:hypothetical protein